VKERKKPRAVEKPAARNLPAWAIPAMLAACVLVFYWTPLTSPTASIQWDAADLHYPLERYFADHVRSGALPHWTPFVYAGYPFLAYPETGAWYPLNWPFFLTGITPRAIEWQVAVSALVALLGAWFFFARVLRSRAAAAVGAIAYAFSGFFAGHSSHVGMFTASAWLPWLLAAHSLAMEQAAVRFAALGAIAGGLIVLAGHFQTALYAFLALGLYAVADAVTERRDWRRVAAVVAGMTVGAMALGAIEILPGLELTAESARAGQNYSTGTDGVLHAEPLLTLVAPDRLGAISGNYRGPGDVTQYYFYAGLLLLPLAAIGIAKSRARIPALAMLVPAVWYMLGPAGGLYRIGAIVPGLHKVRAPVHGWFIAAFALAMLAAAGAAWIFGRWRHPAIPIALAAVLFADVFYWNSAQNPMAYARASFDELYGSREAIAARIAASQPPLTRLYEPHNALPLGPLNHALDLRLETTSGYFALEPGRTVEYGDALTRNPKLSDGVNAARFVNVNSGTLEANPGVLPRAYFPKAVRDVASEAESKQAIETLDPHAESITLAPHPAIQQDPSASATVVAHTEGSYRIQYRAASPSLLKLTESWFPGWHATVGGTELPVVRVDHAFMGTVVPAGAGEAIFEYRPNRFRVGAAISALAAMLLAAIAVRYGKL
jgi:hypothetical protein